MNKRQLIEKLWIPIANRLPPDDFHTTVITYNVVNGYVAGQPASIAREYAQAVLAGNFSRSEWAWDRQFTHWFNPYPPEGKQNYAEYCALLKTGNKAKRNGGG